MIARRASGSLARSSSPSCTASLSGPAGAPPSCRRSHQPAMRSANNKIRATASVASPARSNSSPTSQPSHGSESTGISGWGAAASDPANITKRLQASSELSTYGHPNEKASRMTSSGRSGSARMMACSHHGSFDGSSIGSSSRRRSRDNAMPITIATARLNAAPLASSKRSGTAMRNRKDGMSSGARDAARRAVIARNRPAPATRAAPGNRLGLIGSGPERTPLSGPSANRYAGATGGDYRDRRPAHHRRALPGRDPFRRRPGARSRALRPPVPLASVPERGTGHLRNELGGQLAVGRGEDRAAGPAGGGRARPRADDAGHRLLRVDGFGAPHRPRDEGRLWWRADAAALLLQGRE